MSRIVLYVCLISILCAGVSFAEEQTSDKDANEACRAVIEKILGEDTKVIRIEEAEESPVKGLRQMRVWVESVYGETPILFYKTDDGSMYIAGSIFDAEGNNLTRLQVGDTKPRVVELSDMEPNDDYMIGDKDADVKIVMWLGTDTISFKIYDTLYRIYRANQDKVALYMKFYPTNKADLDMDINRSIALSCFKGEEFIDGIKFVKGTAPLWGNKREDIEKFIEERGFGDCDGSIVKKDIDTAKKLKLPYHHVVFVNGTILIEDITKENIARLSGVELK